MSFAAAGEFVHCPILKMSVQHLQVLQEPKGMHASRHFVQIRDSVCSRLPEHLNCFWCGIYNRNSWMVLLLHQDVIHTPLSCKVRAKIVGEVVLVLFQWMLHEVCQKSSRTGVTNNLLLKIYTNYKFSPLKAISESNALSHSVLPCLHELLEGFFRDTFQFRRHGLLWWLPYPENGLPWWPPWAWGTEKNTRSQVRWVGRMIQPVSLSQELTDAQGIVSWRVVLSQLAPLLVHWTKQAPQDLFIDMLVDCLTLWQELHVDDSSRVEERDQHELDFGPRLSCFLWPRRRRTLPLKALALGLRFIHT